MSLKITGGLLKGRRLLALPSCKARPTTSMLRQALFNILQHQIEDSLFLDLFAGSGIMGIEALSRGAQGVVFIEKERSVAKKIEENLKALDLENKGRVICRPVLKALSLINIKEKKSKENFDLVYADAPYSFFEKKDDCFLKELLSALKTKHLIKEQALVFIEAPVSFKKLLTGFEILGWQLKKVRQYGSSLLAVFFYGNL